MCARMHTRVRGNSIVNATKVTRREGRVEGEPKRLAIALLLLGASFYDDSNLDLEEGLVTKHIILF